MKARKRFRQKGKARLGAALKKLEAGDSVALVAKPGTSPFPSRFYGLTGRIEGKAGRAFIVRFLNHGAIKRLVVKPEHLKKLK